MAVTTTLKNGIQTRTGARGNTYRGVVQKDGQTIWSRTFKTKDEARSWRSKAAGELEAGTIVKPSNMTVRDAWAEWKKGAEAGTIRNASGAVFKPGTIRTYQTAWDKLDRDFGAHKLSALRRPDIQKWMEEYAQKPQERKSRKEGDPPLMPSAASVRNALEPLRAIYRRALEMERVAVNPTSGLRMPKADKRRERICPPDEARTLLGMLPEDMRPAWATAFYAGLRLGELMALRWAHVDLDAGLIHVQRSWDDKAGDQPPKSKAGVRKVPIVGDLSTYLSELQKSSGRSGHDLVFGRSTEVPFSKMGYYSRSRTAWKEVADPPTLHDARHTFASYLIAAGANAKALSVVMGHASISITFDTYGHLMPGGEQEVGRLLGDYLASAA